MRFLREFLPPSPPPETPAAALLANRALVRRLELNSRRRLAATLAGAYRSRFRGQGMEFSELRPYQPGDDVRLIDWNVTARTGTPHLRQYCEERSRTLTLLVDLSASIAAAKRELLLETTALLTFAAAGSGDRIGLIAFTDRIELSIHPAGGLRHARRILGELIAHRALGEGTRLAPPLEMALATNRRPGLMILLSDLHAPLPVATLSRIVTRHDLVALIPRDPQESAPSGGGLLRIADRESGLEQIIDLSTPTDRLRHGAAWTESDHRLSEQLHGHCVDHAFLESGASPLPTLLRLFRHRSGGRR